MSFRIRLICISICLAAALFPFGCSEKESQKPTARDYFDRAYQFVDAGNIQDAISLYTLSIEKDPRFADAYYNRGVMHYFLKNYRQAIEDFDKTIALNPSHSMAYASRGRVYEVMKNDHQAVIDFRAAARLGDKDARDYLKSKAIGW